MPRFLLNDGNADLSNGQWTFQLDRRLSNASRMRIKKATYVLDTNHTAAPHVVYMRSNAIQRLARSKHTLVLKAAQHEDSSNVLAALEEQHATGRYRLMEPCNAFSLNYAHIRNLDIFFTDPQGNDVTYFVAAGDTAYPEVVDNMAVPSDTVKTGVIFRAFDTGGSGADYGSDEALNREYVSTNDKGLILDFQSFQTETTYDKLTVRSRNESTDSWTDVFIDHTGNSVPSGNPFTTTHKTIKFWWTSDGSNNQNGWDALIYEDHGSDGVLSGDSSAGFTLTVTSASTTFGETTSLAKFFVEADINTN